MSAKFCWKSGSNCQHRDQNSFCAGLILKRHPERQVRKGSSQNNDTVSLEEGWYSVTIWGVQGLSPSVLQGYIIIYQAGGIHGSKQTEMKQSVAAHCVGSWGRWQCRVRHKARETGGQAVERLQCSIRQYGCEPLEISEELSKGTEMMITFIF